MCVIEYSFFSRVFPIVLGMGRTLDKDLVLSGYLIPKGVCCLHCNKVNVRFISIWILWNIALKGHFTSAYNNACVICFINSTRFWRRPVDGGYARHADGLGRVLVPAGKGVYSWALVEAQAPWPHPSLCHPALWCWYQDVYWSPHCWARNVHFSREGKSSSSVSLK